MNKRQRKKKQSSSKMLNEKYYLKLLINENDRYNPVIKCKNFKQFLNKFYKFTRLYNCDAAIACPAYEKYHLD